MPADASQYPELHVYGADDDANASDGGEPGSCEFSDLGNARRMAAVHGEEFRYIAAADDWFFWDGTRWARDSTGAVERLAKDIADRLWADAQSRDDDDMRRFAAKSAQASGISGMLRLARSEEKISIAQEACDRDVWALNCPNGTLDLKTGLFRVHDRTDLITKICPTPFVPDAPSPVWNQFLNSVFVKQSVIDFVRRLFGYCLTGDVREQVLPILWGSGSNGKSTLLNAFMDTVGRDYAMKAPPDLLMNKKNESHPTERADLFGKRFVAAIETGDGRGLNETLVKELTGGDKIKARRLYENFWEFDPTHKAVICTNHKPRVRGTDLAIWRRLALIPFEVTFWNPDRGESGPDELRQDKGLAEKLKGEAEGILAWAVAGCLEWLASGLQVPDEVLIATAAYRSSQDVVNEFIDQRCIISPMCKQKAGDLYDDFRDWCEKTGEQKFSQKRFGESLGEHGFQKITNNGVWYLGIGLTKA